MKRSITRMNHFDLEMLKSLDDVAHSRLLEKKGNRFIHIKQYGRRNKTAKCYCEEIKKATWIDLEKW